MVYGHIEDSRQLSEKLALTVWWQLLPSLPYIHWRLPIRAEISIKYNRNSHISSFCIHNGQKKLINLSVFRYPYRTRMIQNWWNLLTVWIRYLYDGTHTTVPYGDGAKPYDVDTWVPSNKDLLSDHSLTWLRAILTHRLREFSVSIRT